MFETGKLLKFDLKLTVVAFSQFPIHSCRISPWAMVVTDSSSSMVDEKKKNAPLDSLHDFIPPAFAGDCTHPYSINVNYQELERDEIEFTYTLKWRGKSIPSRLTEIPGLLAEQLPVKAARDSSKVRCGPLQYQAHVVLEKTGRPCTSSMSATRALFRRTLSGAYSVHVIRARFRQALPMRSFSALF